MANGGFVFIMGSNFLTSNIVMTNSYDHIKLSWSKEKSFVPLFSFLSGLPPCDNPETVALPHLPMCAIASFSIEVGRWPSAGSTHLVAGRGRTGSCNPGRVVPA